MRNKCVINTFLTLNIFFKYVFFFLKGFVTILTQFQHLNISFYTVEIMTIDYHLFYLIIFDFVSPFDFYLNI